MSEEAMKAVVGKKVQCLTTSCNTQKTDKATYYLVSLELQDQALNEFAGQVVSAFSFQPFEVGKGYEVEFKAGKKEGSLSASRKPSTEEEREARKAKEKAQAEKERQEYEADQKARGYNDAHPANPTNAAPSASLIPETNERQVLLAQRFGFGKEDVRIMEQNNIVPVGTPITQVEFFFRKAQLQNLNPLLGQIYLLPFGPANNRSYATVSAIDSLRAKALETGQYGGCTKVMFDGLPQHEWIKEFDNKRVFKKMEVPKRSGTKTWTEIEHVLESGDFPQIASITVTRMLNGIPCQFEAEIQWSEYYPGPSGRGQMWRDRPFGQLGKCVEAIALRKAFADSLSKMHIPEEFDRKAAQEEAREANAVILDIEKIRSEIRACDTLQKFEHYKNAHPEYASDPDIAEYMADQHRDLTTE